MNTTEAERSTDVAPEAAPQTSTDQPTGTANQNKEASQVVRASGIHGLTIQGSGSFHPVTAAIISNYIANPTSRDWSGISQGLGYELVADEDGVYEWHLEGTPQEDSAMHAQPQALVGSVLTEQAAVESALESKVYDERMRTARWTAKAYGHAITATSHALEHGKGTSLGLLMTRLGSRIAFGCYSVHKEVVPMTVFFHTKTFQRSWLAPQAFAVWTSTGWIGTSYDRYCEMDQFHSNANRFAAFYVAMFGNSRESRARVVHVYNAPWDLEVDLVDNDGLFDFIIKNDEEDEESKEETGAMEEKKDDKKDKNKKKGGHQGAEAKQPMYLKDVEALERQKAKEQGLEDAPIGDPFERNTWLHEFCVTLGDELTDSALVEEDAIDTFEPKWAQQLYRWWADTLAGSGSETAGLLVNAQRAFARVHKLCAVTDPDGACGVKSSAIFVNPMGATTLDRTEDVDNKSEVTLKIAAHNPLSLWALQHKLVDLDRTSEQWPKMITPRDLRLTIRVVWVALAAGREHMMARAGFDLIHSIGNYPRVAGDEGVVLAYLQLAQGLADKSNTYNTPFGVEARVNARGLPGVGEDPEKLLAHVPTLPNTIPAWLVTKLAKTSTYLDGGVELQVSRQVPPPEFRGGERPTSLVTDCTQHVFNHYGYFSLPTTDMVLWAAVDGAWVRVHVPCYKWLKPVHNGEDAITLGVLPKRTLTARSIRYFLETPHRSQAEAVAPLTHLRSPITDLEPADRGPLDLGAAMGDLMAAFRV